MSKYTLDFESPLREIEDKIDTLRNTSIKTGMDVRDNIKILEDELSNKKINIYKNLNRWQRVQLARHPKRPYSSDYIKLISNYWFELHGDRYFGDDPAILCGVAIIDDLKVIIIGQEKGRGTKSKVYHNFGMTRPEGYRKALRVMKLAEKFQIPIITLIDTPGAYPGLGAEERGQAEAIARNLFEMSKLKVPVINVVIGEGASGGALGIGIGDYLYCFENTWYSVISPEGCATILYGDATKAEIAADSMLITANDLLEMGIADKILNEPLGGTHMDYEESAKILKKAILNGIGKLNLINFNTRIDNRIKKYEKMGQWNEG
tara:strand:+ start:242 stop:1201 length:960 start_codon:yes stop_codon:yes gene_type:complete